MKQPEKPNYFSLQKTFIFHLFPKKFPIFHSIFQIFFSSQLKVSRENKKQVLFIKNGKPFFELKKSHKRQKNSMSWIHPSLRTFFKLTPEESFQIDEGKKTSRNSKNLQPFSFFTACIFFQNFLKPNE